MATALHTYTDESKIYVSSTTLTLKTQPEQPGVVYKWHTEVLTPSASSQPKPASQREVEAETVAKRKQAATTTSTKATAPARPAQPKSASAMLTDFMASERYHSAKNRQNAVVADAAAAASAGSGSRQSTNI